MSDLLSTSLSGLLAAQRVLDTTGHNISNANTDGYSRQRVQLDTRNPTGAGNGYIGNGVVATSVRRNYDELLAGQVRTGNSDFQRLDAFLGLANRVDNLLADENAGLSPSMQGFFDSLHDVADDPASIPARQVLLGKAQALADRFHSMDQRFAALQDETASRIRQGVDEINSLADSIAGLNSQITQATARFNGQPPNDLLDKRDLLIDKLSEKVRVRTIAQDDGSLNVFIGNGQSLVLGAQANALKTTPNQYDAQRPEISLVTKAGTTEITSYLSGGELGGVLDFRRNMLDPARDRLGNLALSIGSAMNAQHARGMDLNGQLGGDFFSVVSPQVEPSVRNTGSGAVSATLTDTQQLVDGGYVLKYDGSNWQMTEAGTGKSVALTGTGTAGNPLVGGGVSLVLSGSAAAGDSFRIDPGAGAAAGFDSLIGDPAGVAAATPVKLAMNANNQGSLTEAALTVDDPTDPALLNNVNIAFTSANTYSINGSGSYAYTAGSPIQVNGWSLSLNGAPAAGDQLTVSSNAGGAGDNRNALALAQLQDARTMDAGQSSFGGAYGRLVAQIGTTTQHVQTSRDAQQSVVQQTSAAREAVSGVNLDEEAANLVQYQQAYQAAAKAIGVADSLFQTLLGAFQR